jgi:WD40 repeat protein
VEVANEALLQEWRRLRDWLDESRADIRMQRVLGNAAAEWLEANRDPGFLLRGSRLEQFEAWVAGTDLALTADEEAFMAASLEERRAREAAEAERQAREAAMERRSRNFLRGLVVVLAVAAIVAAVLSAVAFNQRGIAQNNAATAQAESLARATQQGIAEEEADARATQQAVAEAEADARATAQADALEQRDRAVDAEQDALVQASVGLAGQAMNELNGRQPERAVPLALEAVENYPYTWQARRALGMAVLNHKLDLTLQHGGFVWFSDLSKDGKRLLTSSGEGTLRIWDTDHGEELIAIPDLIDFVAKWSPDESQILIIGDDNEGSYWFELRDGSSGKLLHSQEVDSECFRGYEYNPWSPDGARFVTAHDDGSARVWEASSGEEILRLFGHEGRVIAEWSPAGDLILTNGVKDGLISMWDAVRGVRLYTLPVLTEGSSFRNWSPDGDRFVVRDFGQVLIYESASGKELLTLEIPGVMTDYAKFSPDGLQIITSSTEDGTARLWDTSSGRLLSLISGMGQAQGIVWSPYGNLAAVGGQDGLVRIWDTDSGTVREELHFPSDTTDIHWSPVEEKIIISGSSSTAMVYKLNQALVTLPGVPGGAGVSDWSPDGQFFGNAFQDGSIYIWDAETWEEVFTLSSGDWFGGLAWSPSGDRIMTWNAEGPLRVWDAASGELMVESPNPEETLFDAKWSPDGNQIIGTSWTEEGKVAVWDADTLEETRSFDVGSWASVASWSPDGKRIATTGDGGEAAIRDASTGEIILQLFPDNYSERVEGIAWTKDGERVIVYSVGTGYLFNATTGEELMQYIVNISGVFNILWSVDESLIYVAAPDGTVRVFEVATGIELLVYEVVGWTDAALSPDSTHILITSGDGTGYLYPTWNTTDELISRAKDCCVVYDLTPEEREQFGLPER